MAAHKGDINAQRKLGLCYIKANEDYMLAYVWLSMATEQGSNMAKREKEKISKKMTPEQIAAANEIIKEIKSKQNR